MHVKLQKFWVKKVLDQKLIWQLWNYLPFNFGNLSLTHTKAKSKAFCVN
jgi:hypothetical protein